MQIAVNAVIFWIVVLPVVTLVHELGHALPALILSRAPVIVLLGRGRPAYRENPSAYGISLARFRLIIEPFFACIGFCFWQTASLTPRQRILILAGGPIASALLALLLWQVDPQAVASLPRWAAFAALIQCAVTAIPIRYPRWWGGYGGTTSDGYKILRLLRPLRP